MNLFASERREVVNGDDLFGDKETGKTRGFGFQHFQVAERDKKRLLLKLSDYDISRLIDDLKDADEEAELGIDQLAGRSDPLPETNSFPDPLEREASGKIIRAMMIDTGRSGIL